MKLRPHCKFLGMFSSAILMQALLSASNLCVGLILIRFTSDVQYGYYVLILNSVLLLIGLQSAFIQPPMVLRMISSNQAQRADLIGGLYRGQRWLLLRIAIAAVAVIAICWFLGLLSGSLSLVIIAGLAAAISSCYREFFRMVLLAYRRPNDVLRGDAVYVAILIPGAVLAVLSPAAAVIAALALSFAACCGGLVQSRMLWRHEHWNPRGAPGVLLDIAPLGGLSTAGSAAHWAFSQGYNYLVAGTLDVTAVAALSATRLLMMPVNLLSSGIGSLMLPTASGWLHAYGAGVVFRRLALIASALAAIALIYFGLLWVLRDWVFVRLMHKHFVHGDALLAIWSSVFLVMVFRDQLLYLPGACGMFGSLTITTGISAILALVVVFVTIRSIGVIGAPIGVLVGELANVLCIIGLSVRRIRNPAVSLDPSH